MAKSYTITCTAPFTVVLLNENVRMTAGDVKELDENQYLALTQYPNFTNKYRIVEVKGDKVEKLDTVIQAVVTSTTVKTAPVPSALEAQKGLDTLGYELASKVEDKTVPPKPRSPRKKDEDV